MAPDISVFSKTRSTNSNFDKLSFDKVSTSQSMYDDYAIHVPACCTLHQLMRRTPGTGGVPGRVSAAPGGVGGESPSEWRLIISVYDQRYIPFGGGMA